MIKKLNTPHRIKVLSQVFNKLESAIGEPESEAKPENIALAFKELRKEFRKFLKYSETEKQELMDSIVKAIENVQPDQRLNFAIANYGLDFFSVITDKSCKQDICNYLLEYFQPDSYQVWVDVSSGERSE